jgi:hypothetical protein
VVPAQQEDAVRVAYLQGKEKDDHFNRTLAAIDIIAEEEITRCRGEAAKLKDTEEVKELAVNVAADSDGGIDREKRGLRKQNWWDRFAQPTDSIDWWEAVAVGGEPGNHRVEPNIAIVGHRHRIATKELFQGR